MNSRHFLRKAASSRLRPATILFRLERMIEKVIRLAGTGRRIIDVGRRRGVASAIAAGVAAVTLLAVECAPLFPSLHDSRVAEEMYCSQTQWKNFECQRLTGDRKRKCLKDLSEIRSKCIEAVNKNRNEAKALEKKTLEPEDLR
jgi:hypothetical protein